MATLTISEYFEKMDKMVTLFSAYNQKSELTKLTPVVKLLRSEDYILALLLAEEKGWGQEMLDEMKQVFDIRWAL